MKDNMIDKTSCSRDNWTIGIGENNKIIIKFADNTVTLSNASANELIHLGRMFIDAGTNRAFVGTSLNKTLKELEQLENIKLKEKLKDINKNRLIHWNFNEEESISLIKKLKTQEGLKAFVDVLLLDYVDLKMALNDARYLIKLAFRYRDLSTDLVDKYTDVIFNTVKEQILLNEAFNALEKKE